MFRSLRYKEIAVLRSYDDARRIHVTKLSQLPDIVLAHVSKQTEGLTVPGSNDTYRSRDRLVIFDVDGTLVDSFSAIERAFTHHGMDIGDLRRFQRRRKLLKYLGGLREFPKNLRRQVSKEQRRQFKNTLTEIYRNEAMVFPAATVLLQTLIETSDIRVRIVSRNVTVEPEVSIRHVLARHDIDCDRLDFLRCLPLSEDKVDHFKAVREEFGVNPARALACGDEFADYAAAIGSAISPFIVSYGFEDSDRLIDKFGIPEALISRTPRELANRVCHTLDLDACWPSLSRTSALTETVAEEDSVLPLER